MNTEKRRECHLNDLMDIALKSGRTIFFGVSYTMQPSEDSSLEFVVKNNRKYQIFLRFFHIFLILLHLNKFDTENIIVTPCRLVNFMKKGIYVVLFFWMFVGHYCLEVKGRRLKDGFSKIFCQCRFLQVKFNAAGLHFPEKTKIKFFGWTISLGIFLICIIRQFVYASRNDPWYSSYEQYFSRTVSFGLWAPVDGTSTTSLRALHGIVGIFLDGLLANYWYYIQIMHFSIVVTMWLVFYTLNKGLKEGLLVAENLPEVMDLHFQSTLLLNMVNDIISPITFWSIVFDITMLCFWGNVVALDTQMRSVYIVAVSIFIKTGTELILVADVNSKAHKISEWLEKLCAKFENFPPIEPMKFSVFTSQIYNKDGTGFRGLDLFVVTPNLAITIAGIVVTYAIAVNEISYAISFYPYCKPPSHPFS